MGKAELENYIRFKNILKGTDAEKVMDDQYGFAYIESSCALPGGGEFTSFTTGYNRNYVVSFLRTKENKVSTKIWLRRNYGGYDCCCDGKEIFEIINYGFGAKEVNIYDFDFNKTGGHKEQSYGCCCG